MKKVFVIANTKGGVGKTTIAAHVMPALFPGCEILEIDDNNQSSIFTKSEFIKRFESIKVKECESKLEELTFKLLDETKEVLIIDCGGGNDTKKVINNIKELNLSDLADVTFIVPIMNSYMQAKNAEGMKDLLTNKKVIYALNGVVDTSSVRKDWLFWYGSDLLGLENFEEKLGFPKSVKIPHSHYFEIAALNKMTISDFAKKAREVDMLTFQKELFEKYKDNKEKYIEELRAYKRSKGAKDFLDSFMVKLKEEILQND